jgi:manganese/iron transport system ATP-binding protein
MGQELKIPARLEIQGINVTYFNKLVLEDVTFSVPHGERVAVVGPNGAGKSTLFKALVGLLPIKNGQILIHGLPLGHHQDCVAYVPQREEVDWRFPVSVEDVVMMGRFGKVGWFRSLSKTDHEVVARSMDQMGILALAKRPIGDLSGGQQQRVFLARALAQEPHILLMDEPFTGVDVSTQEVMFALLDELKKEKVTVMVSTHDLNMAGQRFDRILLLHRKLVAYGKPEEVFTREHVREGFGGQVLFLQDAAVIDQCCPGDEHDHLGDD